MLGLPIHTDALVALASAVLWGGGDFCGGMGVKAAGGTTRSALRVIVIGHAISLAALLTLLRMRGTPVPHGALLFWGLFAGFAGALSLAAFYVALSRGSMGPAAAISGLLAAVIPASVSSMLEGRPSAIRLLGFAIAAIAIWLIASEPSPQGHGAVRQSGTMALAIGGGIGFGIYFVALRMDNHLGMIEPLALARSASLVTCTVSLVVLKLLKKNRAQSTRKDAASGGSRRYGWAVLLWALGIAVFDTGGNMLFVAATRMGRLDVVSVLASLYPAATILLAAWVLHQRPARAQLVGMAVALAAILMITL